jgi:hypothetical protein
MRKKKTSYEFHPLIPVPPSICPSSALEFADLHFLRPQRPARVNPSILDHAGNVHPLSRKLGIGSSSIPRGSVVWICYPCGSHYLLSPAVIPDHIPSPRA